MVLSDRKAHCEALQALLRRQGVKAHLLTGDLGNGARQAVVEALNGGQVKVLVAKAESAYAVAKERCDDKSGNAKDVCVKEAKAVESRA